MFEKIKKKIEKSKVYQTENGYKYFVYPYKGLTPTDPKELNYLAKIIAKRISKDVDLLFTFETDGIFITYPVSSLLDKPFVCARKFHYNLEKPVKLSQKTGYYKRDLFFSLNGCNKRKVAIIDCVHSTGGSIKGAIKIFKKLIIEVAGIYVVVNKVDYNDKTFLKKIKNKFFAIYDVKIINDKVVACRSKFFK